MAAMMGFLMLGLLVTCGRPLTFILVLEELQGVHMSSKVSDVFRKGFDVQASVENEVVCLVT